MSAAPLIELLQRNVTHVRERVAAACARAGRTAEEVTLVAVTKYAEPDWVRGLYELGLRDFGESRPQQLVERARELPGDIRWHLIGHLQRNKAELVAPYATIIHSVDSLRLAAQLNQTGEKLGRSLRVLCELNLSGEASKDGFREEEFRAVWTSLTALDHLRIEGLMTMAPQTEDAAVLCSVFEGLRALGRELFGAGKPPLLSMGMSHDFEWAIASGATHIRIGTSLFEGLAAAE